MKKKQTKKIIINAMNNEFTFVAIETDEDFSYDTFDYIFKREKDYIMNQIIECAKYMVDNNCYEEQTYFQLIWKNNNTDFTLGKYNILTSLEDALIYFKSVDKFELCSEIKNLIDKVK